FFSESFRTPSDSFISKNEGMAKVKEGRLGNLETPTSGRKLKTALHAKAKAEPEYRFYLLYDKVYRADVLSFAYARCKANGGAAGVDGQTFDDIEAYGSQDEESGDRNSPDIHTDWKPWLCVLT